MTTVHIASTLKLTLKYPASFPTVSCRVLAGVMHLTREAFSSWRDEITAFLHYLFLRKFSWLSRKLEVANYPKTYQNAKRFLRRE